MTLDRLRRLLMGSVALALATMIALTGCAPPDSGRDASAGEEERTGEEAERKSPFATGNVSVAPQVEGRAPVPTPVPPPVEVEPTPPLATP